MTLSGGMKRRVLIAKALSHEPTILFLDEPTAGVDVELRHDMWKMVRELRESGVTIILTTHYIEEAQEMADRIGVINKGELIVVEDKDVADAQARQAPADAPARSSRSSASRRRSPSYALELSARRHVLTYTFDVQSEQTGIAALLQAARRARHRLQGSALERELARGHLRQPREGAAMNVHAIRAIYRFEMARTFRTRDAEHRRRRCCRRRSTSSCSARRSARAWATSAASATARSSSRASSCCRCSARASRTRRSGSICRSGRARSTSCCRRRCRSSRS